MYEDLKNGVRLIYDDGLGVLLKQPYMLAFMSLLLVVFIFHY
jgi:hypothetical protein